MHSRGEGGSSRSSEPESPGGPSVRTYYLVVWWMSQSPCAAVLEHEEAAAAAAKVRNGLLIAISGDDVAVDSVTDWYRRDEEGQPMPAEWRDLAGHVRFPWHSSVREQADVAATA